MKKIKAIVIIILFFTLIVVHNLINNETTLFGALALPITIWFGLAIFIMCNAGVVPGRSKYQYIVEDDFDKALKEMKKNKEKNPSITKKRYIKKS
ncbi:hypothetical protein [Fibrobacter sp. UWR2]|uniref:hypothetical protein n=1 Tax=Fibrobacter sp. UWR2 TaxID=1964352 RepID=UPI000B5239B3|nr:hypothetical protein [Fibrobacter sp. UWR2]OWU99030.1 hypothetical protein B7994_12535 [Fibrobacter sp. UWR2]